MAFEFRHFKKILENWISYVVGHSTITDINPGSIVRTMGEATALELAQAYVQMQSILDLFSIDKASGSGLDERAVDFGLTRNQPSKSSGVLTIGDSNLPGPVYLSTTTGALTGGATTTVPVVSTTGFSTTGNIVIERGTPATRELKAYTSKDATNFYLSSAVNNSHSSGVTVHLSTVGVDRTIPIGTIVRTGGSPDIKADTTDTFVLYDGEYQIQNVTAQSEETGVENNVSAGLFTIFGTPPFPTATVTNPGLFYGGQDYESDEAFRARIKESIQALSSATRRRIEFEALNVKIESTGQRVITAKVVEPIAPGASTLYINDGTASYTPGTQNVNQNEFLIGNAEATQKRAYFKNWPLVSNSERVFVSKDRGVTTSVAVNEINDTTKAWGVNVWTGFKAKDENNVVWSIASNTGTKLVLTGGGTPQFGAYAIFNPAVTAYPTGSLLVKNVDYILNDTNGNLELIGALVGGLLQHDCLVAYYNGALSAYIYYDGLLQLVQKVLNGDPTDFTTYPGVIAAGSVVYVTAPSVQVVTVEITISAKTGIDESTIRGDVARAILAYVNSLNIGDDVLIARIVQAALSIDGVYDVVLITPTSNVPITDAQLAKTTLSDITVT